MAEKTSLQLSTVFVNHCLYNTVFVIETRDHRAATAVIIANWF